MSACRALPEIATIIANGWLLGREFFELASLRHLSRRQSDACGGGTADRFLRAGLLISVLTVIPFVDLIAPFFGSALMAHLFKRLIHRGTSGMKKLALVLLLCTALAGLRHAPPPAASAQVSCPKRRRRASRPARRVCMKPICAPPSACPALVRHDGTAQIWRFDGASCKAFFFLYSRDGATAVWHVETMPRGVSIAADENCLNVLRAQRGRAAGFLIAAPSFVLSLKRHRSRTTQVGQKRLARHAGVAPVQDQPVMRVQLEFVGHFLLERQFDRQHVLARRQAGAIADAEDVRVDGDGLFAESDVQNDVGRLASGAGQRLQFLARARNLAAVTLDQTASTAR